MVLAARSPATAGAPAGAWTFCQPPLSGLSPARRGRGTPDTGLSSSTLKTAAVLLSEVLRDRMIETVQQPLHAALSFSRCAALHLGGRCPSRGLPLQPGRRLGLRVANQSAGHFGGVNGACRHHRQAVQYPPVHNRSVLYSGWHSPSLGSPAGPRAARHTR